MTEAASRLPRYEDAVRRFRIEDEIARLDGDPATAINAYVECCGRHTGGNRLALRAISAGGELREFTFDDLADMSGRAGNVLKDAGVRPGDVVAGLLPRIPELVALILGVWRVGAIYQPLFTAFGPKAIEHRLKTSSAKLVVTNPANRGKLDEIENHPRVATILDAGDALPAGDIDFRAALAGASPDCAPVMRKGSDLFMMMSTSGTTGFPKGVPVPLNALMAFGAYMRDWKTGDPLDPENRIGALVSKAHFEKVKSFLDDVKAEKLSLAHGGETYEGAFIEPTVVDGVTPKSRLFQEEIFGPILSVTSFETLAQAATLANDTNYGLTASIYTGNLRHAIRLSRDIRAGLVTVNCFGEGDASTPFGGYKESGFGGRDNSGFAYDNYCELKTIGIDISERFLDETIR